MVEVRKSVLKADIREFKLTNGQTIIGELVEASEQDFVLYDPYIIDASSNTGVAVFRKWFVGAEEGFQNIKKAFVMSHAECRYEVKEAYIKNVVEEKLMDEMANDPDNYEFYSDTRTEDDPLH